MQWIMVTVYMVAGEPMADASVMGPFTYARCHEIAATVNDLPTNPMALGGDPMVLGTFGICAPYRPVVDPASAKDEE